MNVNQHPEKRLSVSGYIATIEKDRFVPGSYQLVVDGTPQSHVNLDDPSDLFFEYIQRIGHIIDLVAMPGQPITALHLGAGALTLPRYVEATRPGSRQQVVELESDLVDFVRAELPLPNARPFACVTAMPGKLLQSCLLGFTAISTSSLWTFSQGRGHRLT